MAFTVFGYKGLETKIFFKVNWNRDVQTILLKNGMQLFKIKPDTLHTAMLSQYLNQRNTFQSLSIPFNTFQSLKYIASELDCASCNLVCYQLTTIYITTVLVPSRQRNCVFCAYATENEEHLFFSCPLHINIIICWHPRKTSERCLKVQSRLHWKMFSWKSKTNMFQLAKFIFRVIKRCDFTDFKLLS